MEITKVVQVKLSDIQLDGANVRSDLDSQFSKENLQELADNIRINGLLQPIVLRGISGHPPYDVIVGKRRFLAHQLLNEDSINATFSGEVNDMKALLLSLSENMCRQEMNFEDTSKAITTLYKNFENDERQVQAHTGFSIRMIRSYVGIEEQASDKIKGLLKEYKISMADAKRAIEASQGDKLKSDILIDELVKLTTYEKKRLVETGVKNPDAKADELLQEARKPKYEETLILNLPLKVHTALKEAASKLSMEMEEVTMNALVNWLKTNEFLVEA